MNKAVCVFLGALLCAACLSAQTTFVYTNNDRSPNSVSAFVVAANGALTPIPGSPFPTGGNGSGGASYFAPNRITTAVVKNFLYAADSGSHDVSAFLIDRVTGALTAIPGSPFPTGGAGAGIGTSLAATPDDRFLMAANGASATITVYAIAPNGALTPVAGSPFPSGSTGPLASAKVTPDGKFLAISWSPGFVSLLSISATGGLTPVPGSTFQDTGAAGIDCNCAASQFYVAANGQPSALVDVLNIGSAGGLSRIPGSPFAGPGANSNVALLSPDQTKLFVSNQGNNTVTSFTVAPGGALAVVPGSPFPATGANLPSGLATNQAGTFLYSAALNNVINGFSIAPNGALMPVPGSPFSNGFPNAFGMLSLTVFPPKTCCPAPEIGPAAATPALLWPPNHKMVEVAVDYVAAEPCPHECVLTVSSNEPVNGAGDGNSSPDWQVIDAHHVLLMAERAGNRTDRVYTITITCTNDTNTLSSAKTVTVVVPHDKRK